MKRLGERMLVVKCWVSSTRLAFCLRFALMKFEILIGFDGPCASLLLFFFAHFICENDLVILIFFSSTLFFLIQIGLADFI